MLLLLLYSVLAAAAPSPASTDGNEIRAPIPGGRRVPLFWDVQAFPDGPTLKLNGTIQEMHKQLLDINPNYDTDFNHTAPTIEKRTNFQGAQLECRRNDWGETESKGFVEGIDYLRKHRGVPHMGPGPGACSRVSCCWHTGIWMCNDVGHPPGSVDRFVLTVDAQSPADKYLVSFGSVADGAEYIWKTCKFGEYLSFGGQVFHPTKWNVILSQQDC